MRGWRPGAEGHHGMTVGGSGGSQDCPVAADLAEEILLTRAPEVAGLPPGIRLVTRLAARSRALSRRGTTVLRYRF